jgi:hypothetical protein
MLRGKRRVASGGYVAALNTEDCRSESQSLLQAMGIGKLISLRNNDAINIALYALLLLTEK